MRRLDVRRVARLVEASTGHRLAVIGPCPGGEVGAAYVRWPDGHVAVLTWRPNTELVDIRDQCLVVVDLLRQVGYPAPRTELAVGIGDGVALVQQLLPGSGRTVPADRRSRILSAPAFAGLLDSITATTETRDRDRA